MRLPFAGRIERAEKLSREQAKLRMGRYDEDIAPADIMEKGDGLAMFIAAMIATAAVTNDIEKIISSGLAQIPHTSRLYDDIMSVVDDYNSSLPQKDCFDKIHKKYDEYSVHGWCHTNSNAMIVAASLLYGNGDFGNSICMAVETGFDTDCNGATVGSILGMANGISSIDDVWKKPINNKLHTSIFGVGTVNITDVVELTMKHIEL